ncbi:MAG: hypothetical protein NC397_02915 [Clostridium sp.]|nr:hypothetical protein [Clostridium sp.]
MDFLKEWTLTVSVTLIIAIILSILAPKGNMGKFFKIMLGIFIFATFIYPINSSDISFNMPDFDESVMIDKEQESYENIITSSIKSALENAGYQSSKVTSNIKYNDNEITVNKLIIEIQDKYDKEEVKKFIRDETGFNPEVYYLGE